LVNNANANLFIKLGDTFVQNGHEVVFIALQPVDEALLIKRNAGSKIYSPERYLRENWEELDESSLAELQEKYGRLSLWDIYYADRWLVSQSRDSAVKYIVGYIRFYEHLYSLEKPDLLFYELISNFTAFMGKYIGEYFGVAFRGYCGSRFDYENTILMADDECARLRQIEELYKSDHVFSEEEIQECKKKIEEIRQTQVATAYMQNLKKQSRRFGKDLLAPLRYIRGMLQPSRRKAFLNKYDYVQYGRQKDYKNLFLRFFRFHASKKYCTMPNLQEDYFFFPLHFQPEASTLLCARKYVNQAFFIEQLSKSIPAGVCLYVKDHIVFPGHKPVSFFKTISKLPNVKIISSEYNTYALTKHAKALVVLTSTVGLEALLLQIPVYVAGEVFYDFLPCVTKINDVYTEQALFKNPKPVPEEQVIRLLCSYFKCMRPACSTTVDKNYDTQENASRFYEAILAEL